jgi:hypothetical protein
MQEAKVVGDFLFPADEEPPSAIEPRMSAFDFPTTRLTAAVCFLRAGTVFGGNVWHVTAATRQPLNRFADISFVETEMLSLASGGSGAWNGDVVDRFLHQFLIMHICAGHRHADGHATAIDEHRPLDAELAPIGRVFPGFFPRPAAPWSSPHPCFAIASRYLFGHRTLPRRCATVARRYRGRPIPESMHGSHCLNRTRAASLSIDSTSRARKRFRWRLAAWANAACLPWDSHDTWEVRAPGVSTAHRESGETLTSNSRPRSHLHVIGELVLFSPLRANVAMCSVYG